MGLFGNSIGDTKKRKVLCSRCNGGGWYEAGSDRETRKCDCSNGYEYVTQTYSKCYYCDGSGEIKKEHPLQARKFIDDGSDEVRYMYLTCSECDGKGALWR